MLRRSPRLTPFAPRGYADYEREILPELVARWEQRCFCASPAFLKLLSFDFRDYRIAPVALIDTEILVTGLLCRRFREDGRWRRCPQCDRRFAVTFEDFSIRMSACRVELESSVPTARSAARAGALVRFAGHDEELSRIRDFVVAADVESYVEAITRAE